MTHGNMYTCTYPINDRTLIYHSFYNIHGHHPFPVRTLPKLFSKASGAARASRGSGGALSHPEDSFNIRFNNTYCLASVPSAYKLQPLTKGTKQEFELASTYGIVKTVAALVQLCYGSYELYAASANQFRKYGYAAYSLTIIPHVIMSLLTLAASASQPSYPSKYIVYYRGKDMPEAPSTAEEDPLLFADRKDRPREDWIKKVESVVTGHVGYTYGDPSHAAGGGDLLLGWVILGLFFSFSLPCPTFLSMLSQAFKKVKVPSPSDHGLSVLLFWAK